MSPTQYVEALVAKWLRCDDVYDKYVLKAIFIECVHESVGHSMRSYLRKYPEAALYDPS